jgi:hypothetical protein
VPDFWCATLTTLQARNEAHPRERNTNGCLPPTQQRIVLVMARLAQINWLTT